jgi:hypothetical protein
MPEIAAMISDARRRADKALEELVRWNGEVAKLQSACKHVWRFSWQVNAYHEHEWQVTYQCTECGIERVEKGPPVCEMCDFKLIRAGKDDKEAERERKRKKYQGHDNPPLAFRCTNEECRKIHILYHLGD